MGRTDRGKVFRIPGLGKERRKRQNQDVRGIVQASHVRIQVSGTSGHIPSWVCSSRDEIQILKNVNSGIPEWNVC